MELMETFINKLNELNFKEMYNNDFLLTWEKTDDEIKAVFTVAEALKRLRENNISPKIFDSGLGVSLLGITQLGQDLVLLLPVIY